MVKIHKQDDGGNHITELTLSLCEESLVVLADCRVTIHEEAKLLRLDGDDFLDDVLPLTKNIEDLLAVDFIVKDDCNLPLITPFCAIALWSG